MKIFTDGESITSHEKVVTQRYLGKGNPYSRVVYETETEMESNLASEVLIQCAQRGIGPSNLITFGCHPLRIDIQMAHYLQEGLVAMSKDEANGKSARDLFMDISKNLAELSLRAALNSTESELSMPIIPDDPTKTA